MAHKKERAAKKSNGKPDIRENVAFDRMMRGLISVPRTEIEAQERKYRERKAKKA
jgi:hypothetical protein